jgi:hydrogenase maturation protease
MNSARIICIGNRYVGGDDLGPRVFDRLVERSLDGIDVVDGGIGGLRLLGLIEGVRQVIFVDTVSGFGPAGQVLEIDVAETVANAPDHFDHDAGLSYVVAVLPEVCDGPVPRVSIIGIERGATDQQLDVAAQFTVDFANTALSRAVSTQPPTGGS